MSLPLTPHMLAAAYDFLRECPPFKGWKLPDSDAVQFHVTRHRDRYADHNTVRTEHVIRVSSYHTKTTDSLMQAIAHELIHARQAQTHDRGIHGPSFRRAAVQVCRAHGWDMKGFVG